MTEALITLAHGSGGERMQQLITETICRYFDNPIIQRMDDAAVLPELKPGELPVFSTDGFVVQPLVFPGGDIGKLAVCGTVNDLAMMAGRPLALSCGLILEEGLPVAVLKRMLASMRAAARAAGVRVVCGDTKVVPTGSCDKMYITTAGVGAADGRYQVGASRARPGDCIIVSGPIGEHEIAVLNARENLGLSPAPRSDCAPLYRLVSRMLRVAGLHIRVLRDPTRGGIATVLNEISRAAGVAIEVDERKIPVKAVTRAACELLGLDPLYLACEGRLVAFVAAPAAELMVRAMRRCPGSSRASIIGRVAAGPARVVLRTTAGVPRVLDMMAHAQMPRIC